MDIGVPSAHHEETIHVDAADLSAVVETALKELGWNDSENPNEGHEREYRQFFRPDHTWWKNRWTDGSVQIIGNDKVRVFIAKFVIGDVVDWTGECKKLVAAFHEKLLEVAARSVGYR